MGECKHGVWKVQRLMAEHAEDYGQRWVSTVRSIEENKRRAQAREALAEFCRMNCDHDRTEAKCGASEGIDACKLWVALTALGDNNGYRGH